MHLMVPDTEWACYAPSKFITSSPHKRWKDIGKKGWIFNIGSIGEKQIVAPNPEFETYRVAKSHLVMQVNNVRKHSKII